MELVLRMIVNVSIFRPSVVRQLSIQTTSVTGSEWVNCRGSVSRISRVDQQPQIVSCSVRTVTRTAHSKHALHVVSLRAPMRASLIFG